MRGPPPVKLFERVLPEHHCIETSNANEQQCIPWHCWVKDGQAWIRGVEFDLLRQLLCR